MNQEANIIFSGYEKLIKGREQQSKIQLAANIQKGG